MCKDKFSLSPVPLYSGTHCERSLLYADILTSEPSVTGEPGLERVRFDPIPFREVPVDCRNKHAKVTINVRNSKVYGLKRTEILGFRLDN